MKTIFVDVNCQLCGVARKVEVDPEVPEDLLAKLMKLFACDQCQVAKGYLKPKQKAMPFRAAQPSFPTVYKDD